MPFYEYRCDCGNIQDEFHSMKIDPIIRCSVCGLSMRRIIFAPRINFNAFDATEYLLKPRGSKARKEYEAERNAQKDEVRETVNELAKTLEDD